jgi:hypothetical protein
LNRRSSSLYLTFTDLVNACLKDLHEGVAEPLSWLAEPQLFALDDLPFNDDPLRRVATWQVIRHALLRFRLRRRRPSFLVMDPNYPMIQPMALAARWIRGAHGVRTHEFQPPPRHLKERWAHEEAARLGLESTPEDILQTVAISPWNFPAARGELLRQGLQHSMGS